jgi:hypothetical protein
LKSKLFHELNLYQKLSEQTSPANRYYRRGSAAQAGEISRRAEAARTADIKTIQDYATSKNLSPQEALNQINLAKDIPVDPSIPNDRPSTVDPSIRAAADRLAGPKQNYRQFVQPDDLISPEVKRQTRNVIQALPPIIGGPAMQVPRLFSPLSRLSPAEQAAAQQLKYKGTDFTAGKTAAKAEPSLKGEVPPAGKAEPSLKGEVPSAGKAEPSLPDASTTLPKKTDITVDIPGWGSSTRGSGVGGSVGTDITGGAGGAVKPFSVPEKDLLGRDVPSFDSTSAISRGISQAKPATGFSVREPVQNKIVSSRGYLGGQRGREAGKLLGLGALGAGYAANKDKADELIDKVIGSTSPAATSTPPAPAAPRPAAPAATSTPPAPAAPRPAAPAATSTPPAPAAPRPASPAAPRPASPAATSTPAAPAATSTPAASATSAAPAAASATSAAPAATSRSAASTAPTPAAPATASAAIPTTVAPAGTTPVTSKKTVLPATGSDDFPKIPTEQEREQSRLQTRANAMAYLSRGVGINPEAWDDRDREMLAKQQGQLKEMSELLKLSGLIK